MEKKLFLLYTNGCDPRCSVFEGVRKERKLNLEISSNQKTISSCHKMENSVVNKIISYRQKNLLLYIIGYTKIIFLFLLYFLEYENYKPANFIQPLNEHTHFLLV